MAGIILLGSHVGSTAALATGLVDNSFTMSSSLTYTVIDTIPETFVNTSYYNASRVLGIAGNFHIVAFDTVTLEAHTNGNILANTVLAGSNFGTNNVANEASYIQHYTQVNSTSGSSTTHVLALGSEETVALEDNGNALSVNGVKLSKPLNVFQDDDTSTLPFVDMGTVRSQVQSNSARIGNYREANVIASFADENNRTITLTEPDELGVYNTTASAMDGYSGRPIKLTGFSPTQSGSIIINIDCSGVTSFTMPDLKMFFLDGSEARTDEKSSFTEGRVLLNFINCIGANIEMKITKASMLALGANVTLSQNFNGTIIAENITVAAESHRDDYVGKITSVSDPTDPTDPSDPSDPGVVTNVIPKTGDASMPTVWLSLMMASAGGFSLSLLGKRKKKSHR